MTDRPSAGERRDRPSAGERRQRDPATDAALATPRSCRGVVVALLGAESTGKTTLATALAAALADDGTLAGDRIAVVPEYLREFCDARRRTPRRDEQAGIADTQTRRIATAAATHDLVIADTTALMTAVYHDKVFDDPSLYPVAEAAHAAGVDVDLLAALDLPWAADGLQRDSPAVRAPVDRLIRAALERIGRPYAVVLGDGRERTAAALAAVRRRLACVPRPEAPGSHPTGWRHVCDRCGDAACERRLSRRRSRGFNDAPANPAAGDRPA